MISDEKFDLICKLEDILILSTRQEKNYNFLFDLVKKIIQDEYCVVMAIKNEDKDWVDENIRIEIPEICEIIDSKQLTIISQKEIEEDDGRFLKIHKDMLQNLGYKKFKLLGICINRENKKIKNIYRLMKKLGYGCFCYNNILNFEIKQLLDICSSYQAILFESDDNIEMYGNQTIRELELILELVIYSVKAQKHTLNNIKNLEKLNEFLSTVSKISDLDEFLKSLLKCITDISDCKSCGIINKQRGEEFKVKFSIKGDKYSSKKLMRAFGLKDKNNEYINCENAFVKFIDLNNSIMIYLIFEHKNMFMENKDIIDIFVVSVKNIINMFLEKIKNELIISQNEKLKALGEISSGIANDFNNILATISGYVSLAMNKSENKAVMNQLEIVKRASLDGAEMLRRIEEFTKDIKLEEKHVFNLDNLIKTSKNMIQMRINERRSLGVNIILNTSLKSRGYIKGRESEIREVIINILNNAIDAMPDGGNINLKSYNSENYIFVEIDDSGHGISQDIIDNVFDPFFSTKGVNGNGIGLSVSYKIIKAHNGNIHVESKENVGSKFVFKLPIYCIENEECVCEEFFHSNYELNVLVVDDKSSVANATGEMLKSFVKDVDICVSPMEAIKKLRIKNYDMVISDLAMPVLNGIELAKLVKKENENIYFVLMTGWLGNIEENTDYIDYILEKPFGMEEIKNVLNSLS